MERNDTALFVVRIVMQNRFSVTHTFLSLDFVVCVLDFLLPCALSLALVFPWNLFFVFWIFFFLASCALSLALVFLVISFFSSLQPSAFFSHRLPVYVVFSLHLLLLVVVQAAHHVPSASYVQPHYFQHALY